MITHDVDSVMEVADHVVVLNLGTVLYDGAISTVDTGHLIHLMAGYAATEAAPVSVAVRSHPTGTIPSIADLIAAASKITVGQAAFGE